MDENGNMRDLNQEFMDENGNIIDLNQEFGFIEQADRDRINKEIRKAESQRAEKYAEQKKAFQKSLLANLTEANLEISNSFRRQLVPVEEFVGDASELSLLIIRSNLALRFGKITGKSLQLFFWLMNLSMFDETGELELTKTKKKRLLKYLDLPDTSRRLELIFRQCVSARILFKTGRDTYLCPPWILGYGQGAKMNQNLDKFFKAIEEEQKLDVIESRRIRDIYMKTIENTVFDTTSKNYGFRQSVQDLLQEKEILGRMEVNANGDVNLRSNDIRVMLEKNSITRIKKSETFDVVIQNIPARTLNDLNKKGFSKIGIENKIIKENKNIFEIYQDIINSKVCGVLKCSDMVLTYLQEINGECERKNFN